MAEAKKGVVFLVEDDLFLSDMYRTKFEVSGYEMPHLEDGDQAARVIAEKMPDLVLLDIVLPKKSGFEVLKELKLNEKTRNIPVVMLTNLAQKDDVDKGFEFGAADYVIKAHFTPAEVLEKIEKVLAKSREK